MFVDRQAYKWPAAQLLAILFLLALLTACKEQPLEVKSHQGLTMGTTYTVKWVPVQDQPSINSTVFNQALLKVNQAMSTYIEDSELSLINKLPEGSSVELSNGLAFLLSKSIDISNLSSGAFDVTVGPLVNLWGFGPDGRIIKAPSQIQIQQVQQEIGYNYLELNGQMLTKDKASYIDLSAIAKGYGVDVLASLLEERGIDSYLVEIGGELRAKGLKPDGGEWKIAIESPTAGFDRSVQRIIAVKDVGIATSGDYRNYFEENGVRFSHTIDPSTGSPITHRLASVTVLMPSCAEADAYATAMMVMGEEKAQIFAHENGIEAFFIIKTESGFVEKMTPGFKQYLVQ
ncbi:FAD:protein FMN transferase [Neptuniibacter sp. SY11_33]|uniref:FAD:protein FMN transferase n=1 Tax=Neptuniibacter sp. SY11_33 TaxID=3398215 RepID=UPI0039F4A3C9